MLVMSTSDPDVIHRSSLASFMTGIQKNLRLVVTFKLQMSQMRAATTRSRSSRWAVSVRRTHPLDAEMEPSPPLSRGSSGYADSVLYND